MNGGSNLMHEPLGPLRRAGLSGLFTPRSASLLAAGGIVATLGAAGLNASPTAAPLPPAAQGGEGRASLFSPGTGDGRDHLRQAIGGSDMVATAAYAYDDLPAGQADYSMGHFTVAHDQAEILPLLREAKALNPRLQII